MQNYKKSIPIRTLAGGFCKELVVYQTNAPKIYGLPRTPKNNKCSYYIYRGAHLPPLVLFLSDMFCCLILWRFDALPPSACVLVGDLICSSTVVADYLLDSLRTGESKVKSHSKSQKKIRVKNSLIPRWLLMWIMRSGQGMPHEGGRVFV